MPFWENDKEDDAAIAESWSSLRFSYLLLLKLLIDVVTVVGLVEDEDESPIE
jgi:hypothetical protein